jgi:membrane protein DedA with SNARE-associated domain
MANSLVPARDRPWPFWVALLAALAVSAYGLVWLIQHDALLWLAAANTWLADNLIARFGYWGVFALMFIESSFIPFPSEIVMPPAGDLARRSAEWSLGGVIAAGIAGSLAGAWFNYALARYLGRALLIRLIARYGRWVRLSVDAYLRSEAFFLRHGAIATFTGRLIPAVRQIISLPAGLARMNLLSFSVLTTLGAGIWVALLAVLGYRFGQDAPMLSEALKSYSGWLAAGAFAAIALYVAFYRLRRKQAPARDP